MKAYIIYPAVDSNPGMVKAYLSFRVLCKENNIEEIVLKPEHLPAVLPGGEIVVEIEINEEL